MPRAKGRAAILAPYEKGDADGHLVPNTRFTARWRVTDADGTVHLGEPASVEYCYRVGMNYVSCSPYRVPIARLAAAQAAISGGDKSETMRTA
jgi:hypothetical protein